MAEDSNISWTDHTFNPWLGCNKVAPECAHCYAESTAKRTGKAVWGPTAVRVKTTTTWNDPKKWQKKAEATGEQPIVFCGSMCDVFEDKPEVRPWREDLWRMVGDCNAMDWLLLTKRPGNVMQMVPSAWRDSWPDHVWIGTSVGHTDSIDKVIALLAIPARTRILSVEPLLERLDLQGHLGMRDEDGGRITQVIVGGESGTKARPMHAGWATEIRDHCKRAGVGFHFKQNGEWLHESQLESSGLDLDEVKKRKVHVWPDGTKSYRVSKKHAGHLLDGVEHLDRPNPRKVRRLGEPEQKAAPRIDPFEILPPEPSVEPCPAPEGVNPPERGARRSRGRAGDQRIRSDGQRRAGSRRGRPREEAAPPELDKSPSASHTDEVTARALDELDKVGMEKLQAATADTREQCRTLLASPELLAEVVRDVQSLGVAGENKLIALLYLIYTSRLLADPLAGIVSGSSGSGKSHLVETVALLIPDEYKVMATDVTPNALFYMEPGALVHRLIVGGERRRTMGEEGAEATRALREMISSGQLNKVVTVTDKGPPRTVTINQPGPIAFVETTTQAEIFDEDANRRILLSSDESPDQNRAVLRRMAEDAAGPAIDKAAIIAKHQALQRKLKRVEVQVPFAPKVQEKFPTARPEVRRAFGQMLGLIRASALLHQVQRAGPDVGHGDPVDATADDYGIVLDLFGRPLGMAMGGQVSDAVKRFAEFLKRSMTPHRFSSRDVYLHRDSPLSSRDKINSMLQKLVELGFLELMVAARGPHPNEYRIVGEVPDNDARRWLPSPEDL